MTTQTKQIPKNGQEVELGEVFIFQSKTGRKAGEGSEQGKYKFFTSSSMQSKFIDEYDFDREYLIFATGGQAGIHYCNEKFSASNDCFVVKVRNILPKYVYYYLKSKMYLLEEGFKGAGLKHLSKNYLQKIKMIYPEDKETQKAIVSILEKAEALKQKREQANKLTDEYLQSVFYEMFIKKDFNEYKIEDLCETSSGGTPSREREDYWTNGTIPWIKSGDLNKDKIIEVGEFITELGLKNSSAKYIEPNTILIAMYGATAGKTSISKIKATTNQAVCAIKPKEKVLDRTYLLYWLRSKYDYIVSLSFGGGQPNISQKVVGSLKIPLPPIELQEKFAKIVGHVEKLKEKQKKSKEHIDEMFNVLMQRAFRCELIK